MIIEHRNYRSYDEVTVLRICDDLWSS